MNLRQFLKGTLTLVVLFSIPVCGQDRILKKHWYPRPNLVDITFENGLFIAISDNYGSFLTSANGTDWELYVSFLSLFYKPQVIRWTGNEFLALSEMGALISSDGIEWKGSLRGSDLFDDLTLKTPAGLATNGTLWVGVGYHRGLEIRKTPNKSWKIKEIPVRFCDIAFTGKQFIAVGESGHTYSSQDGSKWSLGKIDSNVWLFGVAWSGKKLVAVGESGAIFSSPDGKNWERKKLEINSDILDIQWTGTQFLGVGARGTIVKSKNGKNWKVKLLKGAPFLRAVAYSGSTYVAVGNQSTILISDNGDTWVEVGRKSLEKEWLATEVLKKGTPNKGWEIVNQH